MKSVYDEYGEDFVQEMKELRHAWAEEDWEQFSPLDTEKLFASLALATKIRPSLLPGILTEAIQLLEERYPQRQRDQYLAFDHKNGVDLSRELYYGALMHLFRLVMFHDRAERLAGY